jgi:hypothetical protein
MTAFFGTAFIVVFSLFVVPKSAAAFPTNAFALTCGSPGTNPPASPTLVSNGTGTLCGFSLSSTMGLNCSDATQSILYQFTSDPSLGSAKVGLAALPPSGVLFVGSLSCNCYVDSRFPKPAIVYYKSSLENC